MDKELHAAAASTFYTVAVMAVNPDGDASTLVELNYGEEWVQDILHEIPFIIGLDVDADGTPDAVFDLPDLDSEYVGIYAIHDADGNPSLLAHFENGTNAELTPRQ